MDLLRRAFRDIVAGYTPATVLGRPAYIRHLSYAHQISFDEQRERFYREARAMGIKTDEERLADLRRAGEWTDAKELELTRARQHVESLQKGLTQTRTRMPSAVKTHLARIDEADKVLAAKRLDKRRLMGLTCEVWADQEVNDFYIAENLFRDPDLREPLWSTAEFEALSDEQVAQVVTAYNDAMEGCSEQNVKRLAMQPYFQSYLRLAGDDYTACYGLPIFRLTFFQRDLLQWGAHFRHIYSTHDVSKWQKDVLEDPDLLTEYASTVAAKKGELDAQGANEPGTIVLGAKPEDAQALGLKGGDPTREIMAKFGGNVMEWAKAKGGG